MISKELLSEVLCVKINVVMNPEKMPNHLQIANELTYFDENNFVNQINIYELAHKCKEWVKNSCMEVSSSVHNKSKNVRVYVVILTYPNSSERFIADTEPQAIFKACEWILNDKD